jgi:hypothetical protein
VVEGRVADPALAKTVAVEAMVAASKSVPPVPLAPARAGSAPRPPSGGGAPPRRPRAPFGRDRLVGILALVVVSLTALLIGVKSMFSIRSPHGSPWGPALRTDTELVQSRGWSMCPPCIDQIKDRYEVNVYLQPLDGGPGCEPAPTSPHRADAGVEPAGQRWHVSGSLDGIEKLNYGRAPVGRGGSAARQLSAAGSRQQND